MTDRRDGLPATSQPTARYRLIWQQTADAGPRIEVIDCDRGSRLFDWSGAEARYLISSGHITGLSDPAIQHGCYPCDKSLVCHLALLAASCRGVDDRLPGAHRRITAVMAENRGVHLCADEIQSLLAMQRVHLARQQLLDCLHDLVRWERIQSVTVPQRKVFYDLDTRPHAHVYDPESDRVYDA